MSDRTLRGRHRADTRPSTPLTQFTSTATAQLQTVGRRTAVVAASSGLVVSAIGATPAYAGNDVVALPPVDAAALAASAKAQLDLAPVVTAPVDAAWTVDVPAVTAVKPAPPPPPPTRRATTSRSTTRTATEAPAPANNPAPPSVAGNAVLEIAAQYVGTPYRSGGASPEGFDCSGFVQYVYAQLGIGLPRSTGAYRSIGTVVARADAQPGDIIWSPGHVGIYAGDNMQIDSPRPGKTIQFRSIWQSAPVFIRVS